MSEIDIASARAIAESYHPDDMKFDWRDTVLSMCSELTSLRQRVKELEETQSGIEAHIHELCCRAADDNRLKGDIHAARDYLARRALGGKT